MSGKMISIIGSYNVGLFLKGRRLPEFGETVIADTFHEGGGGKGSNQAIACAMFEANTRFIGTLGADKYGLDALEMYRKHDIDTDKIQIDTTIHSGISIILIDDHGNNIISVAPGANLNYSPDDLDDAEDILKASHIVGFQLENDHSMVFYGIKKVKELGVMTFLDPAPAVELPIELYPNIDIIKPNETEATILTGITVNDVDSAEDAGRDLIAKGVNMAIVTLGKEGAVYVSESGVRYFPAKHVDAIDSTGAGDIFSGGLLASLSRGYTMEEAIRFATAAATLSTTRLGVIESIPKRKDVEKFMQR
ncbi:MAG: ribokinase [candidate division KSB1 bacterium]|jgi:ribokinase|nr:ribokinase [candidate division KSB1 bacterium]